jgi:hypothetical protein
METLSKLCKLYLELSKVVSPTTEKEIVLSAEINVLRHQVLELQIQNRKLRDAWPADDFRKNAICKTIAGRFFSWNDGCKLYDTRDEAIDAAAGISCDKEDE